MDDQCFMEEALKLAREAGADGEVPVGCVIVRGDRIVGRGRNRREKGKSALAHAELEAIDEACRTLGGHFRRLPDPGGLAAVGMHPVCHPGALPHVRRSHCQRPDSPGGLRCPGRQVRGGAFGVRPV